MRHLAIGSKLGIPLQIRLSFVRLAAGVLFAGIAVGAASAQALTFATPGSSQQSAKKAAAPSPTLTPEEREAQQHYRIGLEALKNGEYTTAANELTAASKLAPKNALIWYSLAVAESKKGDSASALQHLEKAQSLGLPKSVQYDADQLGAKLSYEAKAPAASQPGAAQIPVSAGDSTPCDIQPGHKSIAVGSVGEWGDLKFLVKTVPNIGTTPWQGPAIISVKAPGFTKRDITIPQASSVELQVCGQSLTVTFEGSYTGAWQWNFTLTKF